MAELPEASSAIELTPDEVEMFPRHLRERVYEASGSRIEPKGWVPITARS